MLGAKNHTCLSLQGESAEGASGQRRTLLCATGSRSPGFSGNRNHTMICVKLKSHSRFQRPVLFLAPPFSHPLHMESGLGDMTFIDGECKQV